LTELEIFTEEDGDVGAGRDDDIDELVVGRYSKLFI